MPNLRARLALAQRGFHLPTMRGHTKVHPLTALAHVAQLVALAWAGHIHASHRRRSL